jgi:16S rRNA C967 or C1407 C5-methylase (RsmB/RsmF family)/NOL1/NOP2/fmu family ribosome biogenesis protein
MDDKANIILKSLPPSLLQDLHNVTGFDEKAFIAAHEQFPVTSVRLNKAKDIGLFTTNEKVPWCADGVYLKERPVFTLDPAYHAGAYYVQEASSMFLDHLLRDILKDKKNLRILDLCAAPGGKSTLIASLLDKGSLLVSNDVIRTRASILEENMTRWGYMNTWVTCNDPRDFGRLPGYFDVILADAPCSGSGLFRKDARALDEWSEANVQLCSERQQRILADVWPALKEDGILVYATCSYSLQEDEQILDWLAKTYSVTAITTEIKEEWGIVTVNTPDNDMTGYRFFPDMVKGEGLFIAAMQKKEETETVRIPRYKTRHDKKIQQMAGYLLNDADVLFMQADKEHFSALRPCHEDDLQILQQAVYLRKAGLKLGQPAGKHWLPAHEAALSIDANSSLPCIDVNKEQALHFLKREDMGLTELEKGWLMVRYNGLGLGWVKSLGNRVNNYLPKHWRIRMEITEDDYLEDLNRK